MPSTWTITPVHNWPTVSRPANWVQEQTSTGGDRADRVVARVEHPPSPVRGLRDRAVAWAEPVVVRVEHRVALPALPGTVEPARARHPHRVFAVRAAAEVPRVEEIVPALAPDDLRALDDPGLPAAPRGRQDLAPHAGQRRAVLRQRLDPDDGGHALGVAVLLPPKERPAGAVAGNARVDRPGGLAHERPLVLVGADRVVRRRDGDVHSTAVALGAVV